MQRRDTLGWMVLLSLALHLTLFLSLLTIPSTPPLTDASEPLALDLVLGEGPAAAAPGPSASTEAAAAPAVPAAPVQQAEQPPPPAPEPIPIPPPPPPIAQLRKPTPPQRFANRAPVNPAPPRRVAARSAAAGASVNPAGSQAHGTDGQNEAGYASGASSANNGAAWLGKLKQWWDQHSFYPKEASQTNEGGNVKARIVIAPDGQVTSIQVVQGSGSSVLDTAAVAVFRNAHLPPFPPGSLAQPADVVVMLHYHPAE